VLRTWTLTSLGCSAKRLSLTARPGQLNQESLGVFRQPHRLPTPQWVDQHSPPCGAAQAGGTLLKEWIYVLQLLEFLGL
jgi:hypothetical protein